LEEEDMLNLLKKLMRDESAQDLAEYGIALAVIGAGAAAVALLVANDVNTIWNNAKAVIDTAL